MEKKPFAFQWHITDACDQRCKHCYIYSADPTRKIDAISLDQAKHVIDQCLEMCNKFNRQPYFSLTGGDPIPASPTQRLLPHDSSAFFP